MSDHEHDSLTVNWSCAPRCIDIGRNIRGCTSQSLLAALTIPRGNELIMFSIAAIIIWYMTQSASHRGR